MLGVVQGTVSNGSDDFAKYEERVAVEVIGSRTGHDEGTTQMETGKYDRQ